MRILFVLPDNVFFDLREHIYAHLRTHKKFHGAKIVDLATSPEGAQLATLALKQRRLYFGFFLYYLGYTLWKRFRGDPPLHTVREAVTFANGQGCEKFRAMYSEIHSTCDACIVLPFPDGKYAHVVHKHGTRFLETGKPLYRFVVKDRVIKIEPLSELKPELQLSLEETRKRYHSELGWSKPYREE